MVQGQAQLASKLDPAVIQAPAASTAQAAGSGLSAARMRKSASVRVHRLGVNEGTNDCDTRRPGLAHASAPPQRRTCLRASRPGWSRAASGSVPPSKGSPVARRTVLPRAEAWGRRVGILACRESRNQIRAGLMLSKIYQMCCVVRAFPPNST